MDVDYLPHERFISLRRAEKENINMYKSYTIIHYYSNAQNAEVFSF